jgi:hypothetical protein
MSDVGDESGLEVERLDARRATRRLFRDERVSRALRDARLRDVLARHERNYGHGEEILKTVVRELGVLPTEYIRLIVTETLRAADGLAESGTSPGAVAAALRWDRDGRPDRLW